MSEEWQVEISCIGNEEIQATETTLVESQTVTSHNLISDPDTDEILELSSEDFELLDRIIKQSDKESSKADIHKLIQGTKIQKVPIMLRQGNYQTYYEPRSIAIGPIHHSNPKTTQTEEFKHKLAAKFFECNGKTGDHLLREIKKNIKDLKNHFDEEVIESYNDDTLARILFLDGCSVLQFIYSYVHDELDGFKINNGQAVLVQQDLLLLENQIPLRVLKLLMNQSKNRVELGDCIVNFILMNSEVPADIHRQSLLRNALTDPDPDEDPVHLLDLLRSVLLFYHGGPNRGGNSFRLFLRFQSPAPRRNRSDMFRLSSPALRKPLRYRFTFPLPRSKHSLQNSPERVLDHTSTEYSIQDLKAAGIVLKPSVTGSLKDITFNTPYFTPGQLELPPLNVNDFATLKLWNLVAYEMCPDNYETDGGISSYLSFLDSLINNEQDVKDLRSAHILSNSHNSDAEVAQMIRDIGTQVFNQLGYSRAYTSVASQILKHIESGCSTRCAVWKVQVYRDHFSSPWTVLALVAALLVLVLTGIQTWFAIHPQSRS